MVVIDPRTETLPDLNVTDGVPIVSDDVYERVTTLPVMARDGAALFEAIVTGVRVGATLSKRTEELSVVVVTGVPALPAESLNEILKPTKPFVSKLFVV